MMRRAVFLLLLAGGLGGCGEPAWFAVMYPNANNRQIERVLGMFKTLAACREAIEQEFYEVRLAGAGGPRIGWECHSECGENDDGTFSCKRVEPGIV